MRWKPSAGMERDGVVSNLCDLCTWLKVSCTFGCLNITCVPNLTTIYHIKCDLYGTLKTLLLKPYSLGDDT